MNEKIKRTGLRLGRKIILGLAGLVVLLISAGLIINAFTPAPLVSFLQTKKVTGDVNSFEPKSDPIKKTLHDGTLYLGEIQYGKKYPNSYLDIYIPGGETQKKRPVFFYVHGGGFAWGEKVEGNPLAANPINENVPHYLTSVAEKGYNVVSINYALTPDYLYPVPLYQIDEAVKFLLENEERYGLDMTEIIFAGESAGGQMIGQYVNIQTNPTYAKEMKMTATVNKDDIAAVVFNSALLDVARMDRTGDITTNLVFGTLGRLYFDTNRLKKNHLVNQANVIYHMTTDFPPSFISDGNTATFADQAIDLDRTMTELGIPHLLNYYEKSEAQLTHGYELNLDNPYAKENLNKMLDFINQMTYTHRNL